MSQWEGVHAIRPDEAPDGAPYGAAVEQVRQQALAEISESGLSMAKASMEIGKKVSKTTLSKWLNRKYAGDVAGVTERIRLWLETRREAARRDMTPAGLDKHRALGVTEDIEAVLSHAQAAGDVVLVHGRSGSGKTWAARHYCDTHTVAYRMTATPVISTIPGLLGRVAHAVGAGGRHPSGLQAEGAAINKLEGRGALLVVDDCHHLSARLLNELRCIRDAAGCGLGLIGENDVWTQLASSAQCDQIVGRIAVRLPLGGPPEVDVIELASGVLGRRPTKTETRHLLDTGRGGGGFHALRILLASDWNLAREEGRDRISVEDVSAAAECKAA